MQGTQMQLIGTGNYDECAALMPGLLHPDYECLQEVSTTTYNRPPQHDFQRCRVTDCLCFL